MLHTIKYALVALVSAALGIFYISRSEGKNEVTLISEKFSNGDALVRIIDQSGAPSSFEHIYEFQYFMPMFPRPYSSIVYLSSVKITNFEVKTKGLSTAYIYDGSERIASCINGAWKIEGGMTGL